MGLVLQTGEFQTSENVHKLKASIVIRNLIVTIKLNRTLDLERITFSFPAEADYRPEQFPAVFFRPSGTKLLVSIFSTGKMVSAGAKTELEAQTAIRQVLSRLEQVGIVDDDKCEPQLQNVVATIEFQKRVYLEIANRILERTIYEPELFPALIHRSANPPVCYLLFAQGKAICLGAKSVATVYSSTRKLESKLETGGAFMLN